MCIQVSNRNAPLLLRTMTLNVGGLDDQANQTNLKDEMAVTYGAEQYNVEAEGEVIRLLTLTGQTQADNCHLQNIKLLGVSRKALQFRKAGISA